MKAKRISEADIAPIKIASLPTRPTAPSEFGGKGYTPTELKEAFDKLPLFIVSRYNELIDDITGADGTSITDSVKTGIDEKTLAEFFLDVKSGALADYLKVFDTTLTEYLGQIRRELDELKGGKA